MAARRRLAKRRNWPENLYINGAGYYWYKHPETGKSFGLGRDFLEASQQARTANAEIARRKGAVDLLSRINRGSVTVTSWVDTFEEEYKKDPARKPNTIKTVGYQLNAIRSAPFSARLLSDVTANDIATWLDDMAERHPTMASLVRARTLAVFKAAEAKGHIELGKNPAAPTSKPKVIVARARLSLDEFQRILEKVRAADGMRWMENAMLLALVSGQRREDLVQMRFAQVHDGYLWVQQGKGRSGHETKLMIPTNVLLPAVGLTIDDVIKQCRDSIVSKHVIHHTRHIASSKPGDPLTSQSLTMVFKQYRELSEIESPEGKTPVTFHEIRSLSARLYAEAYDKEFAQALLGHKSGRMTALYRDSRGQEWTEVKVVSK
jgi:integrase